MYGSLQTCRALAALLVVLFHLGGTFAQDRYFGFKAIDGPFAWGDAGVDFFFVLSGFLITFIHRRDFGHPERLGRYVAKRTLRIYPTYWIVCIAVSAAALAFPVLRQALPDNAITYLAALTLVPLDPATVGGTGSPILFVAWSLQYEVVFYALIAVAIVHRAAAWAIVAALLALHLACSFGSACSFPQSFLASNMILLFGLGVATAYAAASRIVVPRPALLAAAAAVGFVGFGLLEVAFGSFPVDRRLVYGAFASLVILGLVRAEDAGMAPIAGRFGDLLGDASYALYLIHIPVISVLMKLAVGLHLSGRPTLIAAFVAIAVACVAASVAFHLAVERPLLAWLGARFLARRVVAPVAADDAAPALARNIGRGLR